MFQFFVGDGEIGQYGFQNVPIFADGPLFGIDLLFGNKSPARHDLFASIEPQHTWLWIGGAGETLQEFVVAMGCQVFKGGDVSLLECGQVFFHQ